MLWLYLRVDTEKILDIDDLFFVLVVYPNLFVAVGAYITGS